MASRGLPVRVLLSTLFLLSSFPIGLFWFFVLVVLLAAGLPLTIVWVGLPILALAMLACVADVAEFVSALESVGSGGTVLDPEVVGQLLARRRRNEGLASLTPRERDVLALVAEGRTNQAIARTLFVTGGAVEKHVKSIFGKLGLAQGEADHRRVLAVLAYLRG